MYEVRKPCSIFIHVVMTSKLGIGNDQLTPKYFKN